MKSKFSRCMIGYSALVVLPYIAFVGPALAQVQERFLPDTSAPPRASAIGAPAIAPNTSSNAPFGVNLRGIVVLGARDPISGAASSAVDLSRLPRLAGSGLDAQLQPLLGQPLSAAVITDIEVAIIKAFRATGFPFVAVTTPPQDITNGVLNLRVVQFRAGTVTAEGTEVMPSARLRSQLRQVEGEEIDGRQLEQDLEWLNRSPFRAVTAEFSPGDDLGEADITLVTRETRRWRGTLDAVHTGDRRANRDRIGFSFTYGDLFRPGSVLGYRFAASPDIVSAGEPRLLSHSLQFRVPIAARQELDFVAGYSRSNDIAGAFRTLRKHSDFSMTWRAAASVLADIPGEIALGLDHRRDTSETFFGPGPPIASTSATLRHITVGWSHRIAHSGTSSATTTIDVLARLSPGGWGAGNSDADLTAFTAGRVTKARYAYATLRLAHERPLGAGQVALSLSGQWASNALPDSQQMALGGLQAVRGYVSDDASVDRGLVVRTEYRLPVRHAGAWSWQGLLFADAAYGVSKGAASVNLSSIGVGVSAEYGRSGTISALLSYPLASGAVTKAGQSRFSVTSALRF